MAELRAGDPETADAALLGSKLAGRFVLRALLGTGSHGAVFEAFDEQDRRRLALKILRQVDPEALYRFKREFRSISDVSHPNLVTLYELFVEEGRAFFTMRLCEGVPLLTWIEGRQGRFDEARLRDAFAQIATGLCALHRFGRLHCDLKPSNILVEPDGHVLLADFGLSRELRAVDGSDDELVGTPEYMSPEQAAAQALDGRSDWYSVGAMLYEALTGAPPFAPLQGLALLMVKQVSPPPRPSAEQPDVPADLDQLCVDLLARRADERPSVAEILTRFGAPSWDPAGSAFDELPSFFGRELELARLGAALGRTRRFGAREGEAIVVFVQGRSGMGKSALLRRFFANVQMSGDAAILHGRCYERESVPYKGLDVLVDALRRHLVRQAQPDRPFVWPLGMAALARLFPVLQDVPGYAPVSPSSIDDLVAVRREALQALAELLDRIAETKPLVVHLDDAQWCDRDSARFLVDLLRPSLRPRMLLVVSFRSEDYDESQALLEIRQRLENMANPPAIEQLKVRPLPTEEARSLALGCLQGFAIDDDQHVRALADAVAEAAEGSPLFVLELARHLGSTSAGPAERAGPLDLEAIIRARADTLDADARALLEAIAVAGRPIEQGVAMTAAGLHEGGLESLVQLRSRSFVRTKGASATDTVEPYHDRIGTAIVRGLGRERLRDLHEQLARELARHAADAEVLAVHFEAAGDLEAAAEYSVVAAREAASILAFDRAVRLYRRALQILGASHPRRGELRIGLADALAHDGRGAEAGLAYLDALELAPPAAVVELRRRAAEQLLRAGKVDDGLHQLRRVLAEVGLELPGSPSRAVASLLWRRARIRLRGSGYRERTEAEIGADLLLRIDTCWAAATGLILVNVVLGQAFQALHLLLALQAGEPHRVARALGMEMLYAATAGENGVVETSRGLARLEALAERLGDPRALGMAALASGVAELYRGRFVQARPALQRAESILRQRTNVAWELSMVHTFQVVVDYYLGDFESLADTMEVSLEDAEARDDIHTALMIRVAYGPVQCLVEGGLEAARAELVDCQRRWPQELTGATFRYSLMLAQARVERYAGNGARSWLPFVEHWPAVRRSMMLSKQPFRIFSAHDRGCSALLAANQSAGARRSRFLRLAERDVRTLVAEGTTWSLDFARPLQVGLAAAAARFDDARRIAAESAEAFDRARMAFYAAAMQRRAGELSGEASRVDEADARMRELGIVDPARMTDMLVPRVLGW